MTALRHIYHTVHYPLLEKSLVVLEFRCISMAIFSMLKMYKIMVQKEQDVQQDIPIHCIFKETATVGIYFGQTKV